ncbi:DNA repair protein RAD51 homolog 4 [Anopheles cruzii]|uniref:DNA repair protein RAD51 homolog 4 n=1 Tax=Anopheles cruzii TaxID=68878 RepID=UPI0022EC3C9D|nr:DNA repair protein RAD51 homolog 4 [Anopheles cruzii]
MAATPLTASLHPTLTEYVIKLLRQSRITTVYSFVQIDSDRLSKITNLNGRSIVDIKRSLAKRFSGSLISKAALIKRGAASVITTGTSDVDKLLQGGLRPGHIYELCGESFTGKTELCLSIAAHVAYTHRRMVYYIDTKCDFSATKIQHLLEQQHRGLMGRDLAHVMNRIKVERVFSPEQLVQVVADLANTDASKVMATPMLLIIDSLPALWFLFHDSKSYSQPAGLLTKLLCYLRKFAAQQLVSVVLVNIVVQAYGKERRRRPRQVGPRLASAGFHPALGKHWRNAPGTRLLLQKNENKVLIRVWKSSYLRSKAHKEVRITDAGFVSNATEDN